MHQIADELRCLFPVAVVAQTRKQLVRAGVRTSQRTTYARHETSLPLHTQRGSITARYWGNYAIGSQQTAESSLNDARSRLGAPCKQTAELAGTRREIACGR